ncbi:MAG TPA: hypothetical protein VHA71_04090 [Rhodanobacteraceae bacterium]|nr:hypothetical protein [Rhodanobacteraceae bacterium]
MKRVASDRPGFLEELKRRHVWRVAIAYAVAGWLLVQVATQLFPFFNIPNWAVRLVVLLIVIGFPIAVAFAWVYELTPEGLRRTAPFDSPDARSETEGRQIGRKLNALILVVLVLAVVLLGWRVLVLKRAPQPAQSSAVSVATSSAFADAMPSPGTSAAIPPKSVAVLPFANESGKPDEQYFSDGLSEDLITALSQFAGLKVISRNSAFQFRDSRDSSAKIGALLGVAHLLEGSVQRAGDEVRITATLVNAVDGSILWSQRYDKPYKDLFALQDAITQSVADALKAKLLTTDGAVVQSDRPPSGNLAAYIAYQRGAAYRALHTEGGSRGAIAAYDEAIRLDPNYAAAYARLSGEFVALAIGFAPADATAEIAKARAAAAKALALNSNLALAHLAQASLLLTVDMDWTGAEAAAQHALQLAPNDAGAQAVLAEVLSALGQNQRALALQRHVIANDPRSAGHWGELNVYLTALGRLEEARRAIDQAIALQPGATVFHEQLTVITILRGDAKTALATAHQEPPGPWRDVAMALALQIGSDRKAADAALKKLIASIAQSGPYQIAEIYALRSDPDDMFKWLDRAWTNRDPGVTYLLNDPFILRYQHDPRFAAFCRKVGLPTTTDAVAMK